MAKKKKEVLVSCRRKYSQDTAVSIKIYGGNTFHSAGVVKSKSLKKLIDVADQAFFGAVDFLQDNGIDPADINIYFKIREDEN